MQLDSYLSTTKRTFEVALKRIELEISEPWTLDTMAELAGLGRTRFSYYCRMISGMSPLEYLNQRRVETAKQLLIDSPAMSVTDIAMETGFGSSQYFATVFRTFTGSSPKNFRCVNSAVS